MRGYQGGAGLGWAGLDGMEWKWKWNGNGNGNGNEIKNPNNTIYKFSRKTSKFIFLFPADRDA